MSETGRRVEKYIYQTSNGYRVDIRKSGKRLTRVFDYRAYHNNHHALEIAILWRNQAHINTYGIPMSSDQKHGLSRTKRDFVEVSGLKFKIISGVYLEKKNGMPLYFTVSHNNKKTRFSITRLGVFLAHKKALELCTYCSSEDFYYEATDRT